MWLQIKRSKVRSEKFLMASKYESDKSCAIIERSFTDSCQKGEMYIADSAKIQKQNKENLCYRCKKFAYSLSIYNNVEKSLI